MKTGKSPVRALALLLLISCSSQERARSFGGTETVDLPPGRKLVSAAWKDDSDLWLLTRPMAFGETPITYEFREESAYDVIEGRVVIREHR